MPLLFQWLQNKTACGVKTMSTTTVLIRKPASASTADNRCSPGLSALLIMAGDTLGFSLLLGIFWVNPYISRYAPSHGWFEYWPLLPLFLMLYWFFDVYPGVSISPVDEIRRISLANAGVFSFLSVALALNRAPLSSHLFCLAAFVGACVMIPTIRSITRRIGAQCAWWGYPIVLFGDGDRSLSVLRKLKADPRLGLRPIAVVADGSSHEQLEQVPVCHSEALDRIVCWGVKHAVVVAPDFSQSQFVEVLKRAGEAFPHLIVIPDTDFLGSVGAYTQDQMGVRGLQVRNNLLHAGSRVAKRAIDLGFCLALSPLVLPLMAVIAMLIAVESGFPVFYSQKRLGQDGRTFHIWKFRSMVRNASEVLERSLASNPELKKEWAENQKLRNDPRITRIGKVLRKASLDELPQLWNIVKGEMSLVGPRPIVHDEIAKYKEAYPLYTKTIPGLTGLWQVSGRNHTTYDERITYDSYYVRNWSFWMDIYLLARTVTVVLTGDGAY
jgi:Undecaprenyl-phosphate galactose phosphotransferase WbaP